MRYWIVASLGLSFAMGCDCAGEPLPMADSGPPAALDGGHDAGAPRDAGPLDPCGDGLDGDGDGRIDEGCECEPGEVQRCFHGDAAHAGIGACVWGTQRCVHDFEFGEWDVCVGWGEPSEEDCNGVDDDCDGTVDEGCDCEIGVTVDCYDGPPITEGVGSCVRGRITCLPRPGGGSAFGPCEGSVLPSEEVCDGMGDEDCDERIDEGCDCLLGTSHSCYGGPPGTAGVGTCRAGSQDCVMLPDGTVGWSGCTGEVRPMVEICAGGADEDCDGLVDCADPDCTASCCVPWSETLPVVPAEGEILFLVDRSGSMQWPAVGTTRSRWQELETAMGTVLPMLDALPMGTLMFPRHTGDAERGNCMVSPTLEVGIARGTRPSILSLLSTQAPRAGDTPTPQAFMTASNELTRMPSARLRFAVLLTDGLPEPACGATVDATVTAIRAIRTTLGVDTFVIGIVGPDRAGDTSGIPALQAGLNQMADAGGRPRAGATRYYEAVDGPALTSALRAIVAAATDCRFTLASAPARPSRAEVRFDGARVPSSGWTLSGTSLRFSGVWCEQIQNGLVSSIVVSDPCAP
ncbi:MAG: hypothetical protein KF729_14920 [Sandaracinaceae bacterium]|nr:hypothetical protein [Sandaracinaceae bacterium]